MRKLIVLLATAGLLLGLTGSAQAGEFDPPNSTLTLLLGGLPGITISALTGTQSVITLGVGSILQSSVQATDGRHLDVHFDKKSKIKI